MPLTKSFTTDGWVSCEYHVAADVLLQQGDTGSLTVKCYVSAAAYAGGATAQGEHTIPIGDAGKYDDDDVWTKLPWSEVGDGKTQAQRETYLKNHKIRYGTKIVDITTATGP